MLFIFRAICENKAHVHIFSHIPLKLTSFAYYADFLPVPEKMMSYRIQSASEIQVELCTSHLCLWQ